jgi:uncharacterized membrane protein YhaH (DUF805 family)
MSAQFQLVFRGEVLPGFDLADVRRSLGAALKLDEARAAHLFTGASMVLKRAVAAQDADRYVQRLAQMGARVHLEPMPVPVATQERAPALPAVGEPALALKPIQPIATPVGDEVTCPKCGTRQTMRLLCTSCATNLEMALAAQREAEEAEREARRAEFRARRGLKDAEEGAAELDHDPHSPGLFGMSFEGRLARLPYLIANLWVLTIVCLLTLNFFERPSLGRAAFLGLGLIVVFVMQMRLSVLRCHDCGLHGWWALFPLVPYVGFIFSLLLSCVPGNDRSNEYGDKPRPGSWRGLALAMVALIATTIYTGRSAAHMMARAATEHAQKQGQDGDDEEAQGDGQVDMSAAMPSFDAANAYRDEYLPGQRHKAFAISSGKGWGFKVGAPSIEDAARDALADCESRRPAYTPACVLVSVEGQVVRMRRR